MATELPAENKDLVWVVNPKPWTGVPRDNGSRADINDGKGMPVAVGLGTLISPEEATALCRAVNCHDELVKALETIGVGDSVDAALARDFLSKILGDNGAGVRS